MLQLLSDITLRINQGKTLDEVFDLIFERLQEYVPYNRIAVALTDEKQERLSILASRSDGKMILKRGYTGVLAGSSLEALIREGRTRILNDLQTYLADHPKSESTRLIVKEGMRSSLTLPLLIQGRPIGVMFFSSRQPNTYRPEHEEFLRAVAGHMAIAIERTRLIDAVREKSEYLENILQNSADAIIVEDRDGVIRTWNDGARRMYGYTSEEIVGRPFEVLLPPELKASSEVEKIRSRTYEDGYIKDYETVRVTRDGKRVTINLTSTILRDRRGHALGRSAIHRDVTHVKKLHDDLVRSRSLAAVGELAATVAHEIKNPLAGISGAIQVLQDAIPVADRRRSVVGEILDQIRRLDNTVRDLLTFARPTTAVRQEVVVGETLNRAWSLLAQQPGASSVRFALEGDPGARIAADPQLLHQVWINLFQNAVEAMPQGGDLRVTISDGDPVQIRVRDSGTGIDPTHVAKLFRPFFSTKTRGTGLGLAISRKNVEAHGGAIWIENGNGKGTSVFVEIPR